MDSAKKITLSSIFVALLIGSQFITSFISGVEAVTVLLLTFCYVYGVKQGLLVANVFSILRCLIFGFVPSVSILYVIFYNLFAIVFGYLGNLFKKEYDIKKHIVIIISAIIMTILFTIIDNIVTPLMYEFTYEVTRAYFISSLYTLIPQVICTFITTLVLFLPIFKTLKQIKYQFKI